MKTPRKPHPVLVLRGGLSGLGALQILPDNTVATIASTIQKVEGYYPGSLAYLNNNPGNLIFVGQTGAVSGAGGFARFPSYDAGLDALNNQIQLYAGRGLTISQMMNIYAPKSDGNNPTSYAATIANALGVTPDTALPSLASDYSPGSVSADLPDLSSVLDVVTLDGSGFDPATVIGLGAALGLGLWALFSRD